MANWPDPTIGNTRGALTPFGPGLASDILLLQGLSYNNGSTTWTANRAVYQPVAVERVLTVTDMALEVVTQNGNLDVGIYDFFGNKIVSSGSTAVAAAGIQIVGITDTTLNPGWYFLALSSDSSTAVFRGTTCAAATLRTCGFQQQSSAFTLPSTATFAAYSVAIAPQIMASYSATF